MIVDRLENWEVYPYGAAWAKAFMFLGSLNPDTAEGRHEIQGDDIFALVMSYETRTPSNAVLEAHRKYVDIQTVLRGSEGCEWFPIRGLVPDTRYDEAKDAEFFNRPSPGPVRIDIVSGVFVTFFPEDAHMPALIVGENREQIKKVVVKIKADLLICG